MWKIYGAGAEQAFARHRSAHQEASEVAKMLRGDGFVVAVGGVSFEVCPGEILVIMGLSGSGKSTIIRCLTRLIEPTSGKVFFDDADLLQMSNARLMDIRRRKFGMVFQHFGLLPHLTVEENVALPMKIQGKPADAIARRTAEVIGLVGLAGKEANYPRQLSGGQQQRVGIARSLVVDPEIWFLDEPFSALDPLIRRQMQDEFLRLQRSLRKTIVFITHDFLEALKIANRVVIMKDGAVVQTGTPADLVLRPADGYVREFTKDVPRTKVLTAGDVAEPGRCDGPTVATGDCLDDVVQVFDRGVNGANVVDAGGRAIGMLTPQAIVHALSQS